MTERVALAIKSALNEGTPGRDPDRMEQVARAAIEAMREPMPKMINAAAKALSPEKRPTQEWVSCGQKHKIRYQAMIDEALK